MYFYYIFSNKMGNKSNINVYFIVQNDKFRNISKYKYEKVFCRISKLCKFRVLVAIMKFNVIILYTLVPQFFNRLFQFKI